MRHDLDAANSGTATDTADGRSPGAASTTPADRRGSRLPSLTGLRFPAALLVFAYHAGLAIPTLRLLESDSAAEDFTKAVEQAGALGVTFFFVLSGFVLTWSARDNDKVGAFLRRRVVKIYPNYVITWALAMMLFASTYTSFWQSTANLFMLQVWTPDFATYFSVNSPSWSLGVELIFYASFPFLLTWFRRIPVHQLKFWIAGAMAGTFAVPAAAYALLATTPKVPGGYDASEVQYWFAYVLPPARLFDFALGILVALAVRAGRWRNIGMLWSAVLLAGGYVLTAYTPYLYAQRTVCVIPIVLLVAAAATADTEGRRTVFSNRWMVWLGNVSFAFYLLHFIVLTYGRDLLGDTMYSVPETAALLAAEAAITVLLSWALYALVEKPATRHFSVRRGSRSRTPDTQNTTSITSDTSNTTDRPKENVL